MELCKEILRLKLRRRGLRLRRARARMARVKVRVIPVVAKSPARWLLPALRGTGS